MRGARYRGDGSGPAYIKVGRAVRYRRSVLDLWMDAHDRSPDEPNRYSSAADRHLRLKINNGLDEGRNSILIKLLLSFQVPASGPN